MNDNLQRFLATLPRTQEEYFAGLYGGPELVRTARAPDRPAPEPAPKAKAPIAAPAKAASSRNWAVSAEFARGIESYFSRKNAQKTVGSGEPGQGRTPGEAAAQVPLSQNADYCAGRDAFAALKRADVCGAEAFSRPALARADPLSQHPDFVAGRDAFLKLRNGDERGAETLFTAAPAAQAPLSQHPDFIAGRSAFAAIAKG